MRKCEECSAVWQCCAVLAVSQCIFSYSECTLKHVENLHPNLLKALPAPSKTVPGPSKIETGAVHDSKDAPKMPPRALQERSEGTKSCPRAAQDRRPRAAQWLPRRFPNPSKIESWDLQQAFSVASSSCRASGAVGDRFFDHFAMMRKSSKGDFSAHTRCFMRFLPC